MNPQPETALMRVVPTDMGDLRCPALEIVRVGDRAIPTWIEVDFPGGGDQPSFFGRIEVVDKVPRWVEITLRRHGNGREVRPRDLKAIELETWLETFVALMSGVVSEDGKAVAFSADAAVRRATTRVVQDARKGSRRPMTDTLKRQVADIYNAQESRGLDAIEAAFGASRSTAKRYLKAARAAGYVVEHERGK